jgi:hypothetical protein
MRQKRTPTVLSTLSKADRAEFIEREIAESEKMLDEVESLFIRIVRADHRPFFAPRNRLPETSRENLLIFKAWMIRYKVSLRYILKIVLGYYTQRLKVKSDKNLGVSIKTLTSTTSRDILESQVRREYPNGENISIWKNDQRQKIAQLTVFPMNPVFHPDEYRRHIERNRRKIEEAGAKYRQRPFRDNPFVNE